MRHLLPIAALAASLVSAPVWAGHFVQSIGGGGGGIPAQLPAQDFGYGCYGGGVPAQLPARLPARDFGGGYGCYGGGPAQLPARDFTPSCDVGYDPSPCGGGIPAQLPARDFTPSCDVGFDPGYDPMYDVVQVPVQMQRTVIVQSAPQYTVVSNRSFGVGGGCAGAQRGLVQRGLVRRQFGVQRRGFNQSIGADTGVGVGGGGGVNINARRVKIKKSF